MTKEAIDIQKEIEKYFTESAGFGRDKIQNFMGIVNKALKQKGEQIAELEKENAELKERNEAQGETIAFYLIDHEEKAKRIADLGKENAQWKQRNETLKDALEHARKVYGDDLEKSYKEIAELKEKLKPENCLKSLAKSGLVKFTCENGNEHDQLAKATDLLKKVIRFTWGEGWNYSLDVKVEAEQFIKGFSTGGISYEFTE